MHALVAEAMKKAAIVWLTVAGRPAYPVWCTPIGDSLYVVIGGDEQPAPDLIVGRPGHGDRARRPRRPHRRVAGRPWP